MRESSIDFSPYKKTHRPSPSQQSNTLSDISCDTLASDILESEFSETEAAGESHENRSDFCSCRGTPQYNMHLSKCPGCSSYIDFK